MKKEGRFFFLPPNPSHPMISLVIKVYKVWNCRVKRNAKQLVNGEVWNRGCETADLICQVSFLSLLSCNPQNIRQLFHTGFEPEKIFKRPVWDGYPERERELSACETLLAEVTTSGRLNTAWEAQVLSLFMNTAFVGGCRCLKDEAHGWSHPLPPPAIYVTDRVDLVLKFFKQTWNSSMPLIQVALLRSRR